MELVGATGDRHGLWGGVAVRAALGALAARRVRTRGGAQLLLWGWSRRSGLTKPVLPTSAPFWLDRLVSATALTTGIGLVVLTVVELAREIRVRSPRPQPAV